MLDALIGKSFDSISRIKSRQELEMIFHIADCMKAKIESGSRLDYLVGKMIAILFYEPSTRTFSSFHAAATRLGAYVLPIQEMNNYSSAVKGETLEDTIRTMIEVSIADLIILRHGDDLSSKRAVNAARPIPIINAGSGKLEHPTQALLDLYAIHTHFKRVEGLEVSIVGDLKYGRTVKSLAKLVTTVDTKARINFVSPPELEAPREFVEQLRRDGATIREHGTIEPVIEGSDVVYMTRVQEERLEDPTLYERVKHKVMLTNSLANLMKEEAIILHPMPRPLVGELPTEIDNNPRAKYFPQMRGGLFIRMALMAIILNKVPVEFLPQRELVSA